MRGGERNSWRDGTRDRGGGGIVKGAVSRAAGDADFVQGVAGGRGVCGLRVNFMPADLHFSEQYLWMDEIIGMRAGGPPWPLSLKM